MVVRLSGGKPTWSVPVALLFASCLVSKGVGVDGLRDSLSTVQVSSVSRSDVAVKKKVKGLRVEPASLISNGQDNSIFVAR